MFKKEDIVTIISLGIITLLLTIITVIIINNEQTQESNKSNNINKNEIVSNIIENNIESNTLKYVEYKVNYNLTNKERTIMQKEADQREMEGGFDDRNMTR